MSAFERLAAEQRWVAWRNEPRGPNNKITKVPYGANGKRAKADDPATWLTRAAAASLAQKLINGAGGGIGYQLGEHLGDLHLAGLDLDSCRNADGSLTPWAQAILDVTPSYSEISPSGGGVKLFFYIASEHVRPFLDRIGVLPKVWGTRRSIGGNSADHGPAIEFYANARYLAVTGNLWPEAPDKITVIDWPTLELLARLIPPAKDQKNGAAGDDSRSAKAFRKGAALRRAGKSFEEMVAALRTDPETADWVREKGDAIGGRELRRIWEKAEPADKGQPPAVIKVTKGERHKAADAGIAAMERVRTPFYQRDGKLVRVCRLKAKTSDVETILLPGIASVTPAILDRALGQAALWERFDARAKDWLRIDPPRDVGAQIIDMIDEWPFPPLRGIISCPTLRRDGSLLDKEGYDDNTGLVLHSNVKVPPIHEAPSRADAEAAIGLLVELLQEFPFADQASQSVGLSGCLTPVLRGAMEVAPLQLNTSPQPGTGKSYLTDVSSAISTGERAAAIAAGTKLEKWRND